MVSVGLLSWLRPAQAQLPLDVVAGPSFTTVSTDELDTSSRTGFFAGVGTMIRITESVAIRPYLSYVQKGAKFTSDDGEDVYSYIEIPIFLSTAFPLSETVGLGVSVGPQVAFNITCNETVPGEPDYDCKNYDDYGGSTELGLVGSVGLQFPAGSSTLGVGAGFDLGLKDVFRDLQGGYKNRAFFLFVGYGLPLGGA